MPGLNRVGLPREWWVGIPIAVAVWGVTTWVLRRIAEWPDRGSDPGLGEIFASSLAQGLLDAFFPLVMAGAVALGWTKLMVDKRRAARRLDRQTGIDSIRSLPWKEFELLLAEAFRREGYRVDVARSGADGGVDLVLRKDGRRTFVQAKRWRRPVGVSVVRELYGVQAADGADGAILVTSGSASADALRFASRTGLRIIDGPELLALIRAVQ